METELDNIFSLETCPICLDDIQLCAYNYIKTDCKHSFHASCFMMHTRHNGYSCPCCRNEFIEPVDSESESESEFDDSDDETDILNERLHDLSLLSMRYLFSRVENEICEEEESVQLFNSEIFQRGHEEYTPNLSITQISTMFQERGLSYEDMVALCVLPHKDNTADVCKYSAEWFMHKEREIRNMLH